jgi:hypothetical protein
MSLRFYQWVPVLAFTVVIVLLFHKNSTSNPVCRLLNPADKYYQLNIN